MPDTLATLIRKKYPGEYDDLDDVSLEEKVLAKYPEYKDLPRTQPKAKTTDTKPLTTESPDLVDSAPVSKEPEFTGSYRLIAGGPSEEFKSSISAVSPDEPDTYWGGFFKGLKDYIIGTPQERSSALSAQNPYIQSAANPKTAGDILGMVLPSEIPRMTRVPEIAKRSIEEPSSIELSPAIKKSTAVAEVGHKPTDIELPSKKEFDPASLGFKTEKANDEVSNLIKSSGLEAADVPLEVVDEAKPANLKQMQAGRSAKMDARNKGFKGTEQGGIPELDKTNQVARMANESQKKGIWPEIRDANRAVLTAYDFSAPGRQGKPLLMTKAYWTSFDDMFKSWGSERAYQAVNDSIYNHPNFKKAADGGPSLAERAGLNIGSAEQFNSNIAEKLIPGVRPSERAYNAFLNKLRSDHFNNMVKDYEASGVKIRNNDTKLKELGKFINDATGRGSLGKLEKYAPALNEAFFAPKLMASRVNMYKRWLDPRTYSSADPIMRKQVLKSLISTVGFGTAIGELARLGGAQVSNDPTSSDFRKVKIGNTRIDPFSGFQQYAVGATRMLTGETTSSTSGKVFDLSNPKYGQPSRLSVAGQFAQNKLSPVYSLVASWMEGKDWNGQPFNLKQALLDRTVPIVMQDLNDLAKEDPKLLPLGVLPIMGEGIQTYGR